MMKFSRKTFFKGLALGTISLPLFLRSLMSENNAQSSVASGIADQKAYKWKMVTTWPPNFPILGEGCTIFADLVKEMSQGQMDITVYGGGELVPPLEVFNTVRSGAAELGHGAAYYWAGMVPAAQFFASVPFGMNAQQMNAWLISGGGMKLWEECYAAYGLVPFPCGNTGVQMGGWFNREINTIDDLQGLKMRIPGLGSKVLTKAGGAPVLLAGGEIYTGLERGIIDATEWIGPFHDYKMGFHQIAKYYYSPGWHEAGTMLELFINKKKYDSLPLHLQAIMESAAYQVNHWMLSEFEAQNSIYLDRIAKEAEIEIRQFPEVVLQQLRTYTAEVIAEVTENDPFAKRVYESYNTFRKKAVRWSELTEKVFYNSLQI